MGLTEEQYMEMYKASIKSSADIFWIREKLQANDADMKKCFERINALKTHQAYMNGRMARMAGGIAAVCAIGVNAILWFFHYFGGK
jgi:SMC interacting uncharacterized protein involved in chromosome segregation